MTIMTNTRPANSGGIDLSGVDVAAVIFDATGGGYGTPRDSNLPQTESGVAVKTGDWLTNWGSTNVMDEFDFSKPPADPDAEIKLLAEPEGNHPLIDLVSGDPDLHFANGGPEGAAWIVPVAAAAVILVFAWAVDHLSDGAICDALGWEHDRGYSDPEATTADVQSPSVMLAELLAKNGIESIDTSSVGVTDILGKLSDNIGKVADLVGAMQGAAEAHDTDGLSSALAGLMQIAGVDAAFIEMATTSPPLFLDGAFTAFGIVGGLDGASFFETVEDAGLILSTDEAGHDISCWFSAADDGLI
jgi:hypothetical protein